MTFQSGVTLADLGSVSDRDIIKFTATSLGSTTTGTFERYFSGDAVGLNAGIDGLTQLSDNSLLISTDSKSNVVGIGSVRDEDILLFTPDSTGDYTNGTKSLYLDGSKVGLKAYAENIDALSVNTAGDLLLSTQGNFDVTTVAGKGEDLLTFARSSTQTGLYESELFFDGSLDGLGITNLSGFDLASTSAPTPNTPPSAADDEIATNENNSITIDVLSNDSDVEADPLVIASFTQPTNGSVALDDNGTPTDLTDDQLIYTPNPGFAGSDTFSYTISDGRDTDTANVSITVNDINNAPTAIADTISIETGSSAVIDVLANDSDSDGNLDINSVAIVSTVANGILVDSSSGAFSYTPNANFVGTDSFSYSVSDTLGAAATATVTITVSIVNTAPIANNDAVITTEDTAITIDVVANDTDAEENLDTASVIVTQEPLSGTLTNNGDGTFLYTPSLNFNGADSFIYQIADSEGTSSQAVVNVTIDPINDAPTATADTVNTLPDTAVTFNLLDNDTDVEADILSIESIDIDAETFNGTLINNGAGSVTYTPNLGFAGTDTFSYTISDGQGNTSTAAVTVNTSLPAPERIQLVASPDVLINDGFGPQVWGDGVSIAAYDWDGNAAAIAYDDQFEDFGFGVVGGRYDQIDFITDDGGKSERIEIDFGGAVSDAVITLGQLSPSERLKDETDKWTAYDDSGNIVATGLIEAELSALGVDVKVEGSLKAYPIALTSASPFSKVVIEATGFDHGTSNPYKIKNPKGYVAKRSYLGAPFEENTDFNIINISYVRPSS